MQYIPIRNKKRTTNCQIFFCAVSQIAAIKANHLFDYLNLEKRTRWEETARGIDFYDSCQIAWKTFNCLSGRRSRARRCSIIANSLANELFN